MNSVQNGILLSPSTNWVSGDAGISTQSALLGYTWGFWTLVGSGALLILIAPLINKLMHGVR